VGLLGMRFMILLRRLLRQDYGRSWREVTLISSSDFSQDNPGVNFYMCVDVNEELRGMMIKMTNFESSRGITVRVALKQP
jgi:hypothetical protein